MAGADENHALHIGVLMFGQHTALDAHSAPAMAEQHKEQHMTSDHPRRTIIMGAAGRDFHDFNTIYRNDPAYDVLAVRQSEPLGL